jgi:cation transport ATPase
MKHNYNISGMTCSSCQAKVESLLAKTAGVTKATTNLATGTVEIEMNKHVSTPTLQAALRDHPKYQLSEAAAVPLHTSYEEIEEKRSWFATYKPILLIFAYIIAVSIIVASAGTGFNLWKGLRVFMSGFFLVFSFFKMLDLNGFADSYAMYDIVAKRFRHWGYVYAFIELFLGLVFAINFQPVVMNYITLIVMSVSIIGVLQSVFNKRKIKCACLGAVFNLPMSTVTIIEDALMIAMSIAMIIYMW